ncbi:MAG: DUF4010 domain-containing protein [Candidatus Sulfotelmatobacter sp.]|jgi:uncharacterized membrane protein (DUF4010 family)
MIFPPAEIAIKIAIALGVGLLVGFERAWAHKDVGVRTFSLTALLGMLAALISNQFAVVMLIGVFVLVAYINGHSLLTDKSLEMTTSVALIVTFVLGMLVGEGHLFTPVASAILMTMLLTWKTELQRFAGDLAPGEIRGAVLLGLIGFVIYPLLPNRFIDSWHLLNPRQSWFIVIIVAGLGFLNYVLLRLYANRGLYYTAALGGLVNSTATVAELSRLLTGDASGMAVALVLITSVAMFLRNLLILAIFARAAVPIAAWPILAMTAFATFFAWKKRDRSTEAVSPLHVSSPVSLKYVLKFGALFVGMEILGTIGARYLGKYGFLALSLLGGMVSSASATAAAATMVIHGKLSPDVAGVATVFASITSALVNLPLVERQTHDKRTTRTLAVISIFLVAIGLTVLAVRQRY